MAPERVKVCIPETMALAWKVLVVYAHLEAPIAAQTLLEMELLLPMEISVNKVSGVMEKMDQQIKMSMAILAFWVRKATAVEDMALQTTMGDKAALLLVLMVAVVWTMAQTVALQTTMDLERMVAKKFSSQKVFGRSEVMEHQMDRKERVCSKMSFKASVRIPVV
jgi:hypothetical protein